MCKFLLKTILQIFSVAFFTFATTSCEKPCEPTEEPRLNTGFYSQIPFKFKRIYAVGTSKITFEAIPSRELSPDFSLTKELLLPINMNAKTTKYIFESDTRTDSITIAYDLQTNYTSRCGFTFILTNMRTIPEKSSFKDVEVNYYPPYIGSIAGFPTTGEARFEMQIRN